MQSQPRKTIVLTVKLLLIAGAVAVLPAAGQEPEPSDELTVDRLAALTAEIQKEVETLRGKKFKHPVKVDVYTEEQLRAFIRRESLDGEEGWGKQARANASRRMIGLIPQDFDPARMFEEALTGFVPGIYDHKTKTLGIVKREGMNLGSLHVRTIIAHELVHALDDQYFDLEKLMANHATSDADFALGAVVEGSAVVLQQRYSSRKKLSGDYDPVAHQKHRKSEMEQMRALFEAPPFVASFMARFPNGVRFLLRGDMLAFASLSGMGGPGAAAAVEGVGDAVRTALTSPPRSSEQILHLEKYWQDEQRDEPVIVNDTDVEKLVTPVGLHIVHTDTIGELLCAILTAPEDKRINPMTMGMPGFWTNAAATGWGGDRFFLLTTKPEDETIEKQPESLYGLWLTLWDTPNDRDEFIDEYEKYRPLSSRVVIKLGRLGAVFFFSFDDGQQRALVKALQDMPPGFTRDGKPWSVGGTRAERAHPGKAGT